MKRLLFILLLIVSATCAHAEIYTWKDNKGTRFYTNSLHEIPARYLKKARLLDVATGKIGALATAQPAAAASTAAPPGGAAAVPATQPPPQPLQTAPAPVPLPAPQAAPLPADRDAVNQTAGATPPPAANADSNARYRPAEKQRTRGTSRRRHGSEE